MHLGRRTVYTLSRNDRWTLHSVLYYPALPRPVQWCAQASSLDTSSRRSLSNERSMLSVPANTWSPSFLSTGIDSPVIGAWLMVVVPFRIVPSSATWSPGRIRRISPTRTASTGLRLTSPSVSTKASFGDSSISFWMELRVRARERFWSKLPMAKRKTTVAPSSHSPIHAAPMAATLINTFMSSERARTA